MPLFENGNPGGPGRPKGSGYSAECREYARTKGWQKLFDIADGKGYKVGVKDGRLIEVGPDQELQFKALVTIIAYGHGKPPQQINFGDGAQSIRDLLAALPPPASKPLRTRGDA